MTMLEKPPPHDPLSFDSLRAEETAELSRRLVESTSSGRPLVEGLHALVEELAPGRSRRVAARLAQEIEQGISLEDVLNSHSKRFPGPLRGLIRAGTRTGRLAEALGQYAAATEKEREILRGIWLRLLYPCLLLTIAFGLWIIFFKAIVPGFESIFFDFQLNLPHVSRLLISGAGALSGLDLGGFLVFGASALIYVVTMRLLIHRGLARYVWGSGLFLRRLRRWLALSEWSRTVALLLESGVPGDEALTLAGESSRTFEMRQASLFAAGEVSRGAALGSAVGRGLPFTKAQRELISWAENAGSLPETFRMLGEMFEDRAQAHARKIASFVTVTAFVFIFWSVFFFGVALLAPIIRLFGGLSGGSTPGPNSPVDSWWDWLSDQWDWLWGMFTS